MRANLAIARAAGSYGNHGNDWIRPRGGLLLVVEIDVVGAVEVFLDSALLG